MYYSNLTLSGNTRLTSNTANLGGAMDLFNSTVLFNGTTILDNNIADIYNKFFENIAITKYRNIASGGALRMFRT